MASKRDTIIAALTALLQTLPDTVQFSVHNWRDEEEEPFDKSELPAISHFDTEDTITELNSFDDHEVKLEIHCLASGVITAEAARSTANAVCTLLANNRTISGTATDLRRHGINIKCGQFGDAVVSAVLQYTIIYRTPPGEV
jgi:hypothetical protein